MNEIYKNTYRREIPKFFGRPSKVLKNMLSGLDFSDFSKASKLNKIKNK